MPQIYNVFIYGQPHGDPMEHFAVKLQEHSFEKLMEQIFVCKPDVKSREIRVYYNDIEGDRVIISNASDFEIFKESGDDCLFVHFGSVQQLHKSQTPSIATLRTETVVLPPVARTRSPLPVNSPSVQSASENASSKKYAHPFGNETEKNTVHHGKERASVENISSKPIFAVGERVLYDDGEVLEDAQVLKFKTGRDGKMMYLVNYVFKIEDRGEWVREKYLLKHNQANIQLKKDMERLYLDERRRPTESSDQLYFDQVMEDWAQWNQQKASSKAAAEANNLPVKSKKNDVSAKQFDNAQPVASARTLAATVVDDDDTNAEMKCKTGHDVHSMSYTYRQSHDLVSESRNNAGNTSATVPLPSSEARLELNNLKMAKAKEQQAVRAKTSAFTFPTPPKSADLLYFDQVMEEWARWNQQKAGPKDANVDAGTSSTKATAVRPSGSTGPQPIVTAKNARQHNRTFFHTGLTPTTSIFEFTSLSASKSPFVAEQAKASASEYVNKLPLKSKKSDVSTKQVDNTQPIAFTNNVEATDDDNTNVDVSDARARDVIEKRKETAIVTAAVEQKSVDAATDVFVDAHKQSSLANCTDSSDSSDSDSSTSEEDGDVLTSACKFNLNTFEEVYEKKFPVKEQKTPSKVPEATLRSGEKASVMSVKEKAARDVMSKPTDEYVEKALASMIAMGFSNECGWLTRLLETVKGDVSRAFDLMNPQK